jgi:uncharacterized membrane protein
MAKRGSKRKPSRAEVKLRRKPDWQVIALAAAGMAITAFLTWSASTAGPTPLCGPGSACDLIQASHWSSFMGLPVALWGFFTYAVIALLAFEMRPSLKRWRWLWTVALIGVAVSVYLTVVGIVALQAVCLWCLSSLSVICALFVLITWKRPESAPGGRWRDWLLNTGSIVVLVLVVMQLHYSGLLGPGMGREDPQLRALAEHLDERNARFYGAYWCPACQQQKTLFGASADRLPYIECTPDGRRGPVAFTCVSADIDSYPTWIIEGRRYTGVLEPHQLARHSGFDWESRE